MAMFLTSFDNVIFTLLFIVYLIALSRMLAAAQSSTINLEYEYTTTELTTEAQVTEGLLSTTGFMVPDQPTTTEGKGMPETSASPRPSNHDNKIVKIAMIFERPNVIKWFDAAVDYLNQRSNTGLEFTVVSRFPTNRSDDAVGLVTKLCKNMDALMSTVESRPDIIMDFTISGIPSETVKIITKTLKLPTVSTSVGRDEDVREWSWLTGNQEKYLIRIQPPMDVLDQAIRSVSELQNISNAAVLFQEGIEMRHKFKSILKDVPTKHKLVQFPGRISNQGVVKFKKQLQKLAYSHYTNYFLVGSSKAISMMLPIINSELGRPQHETWYTVSTDGGPITCDNCVQEFQLVSFIPKDYENSHSEDSRKFLASKLGSDDVISLRNRIYFDLTIDAALAVGEQKLKMTWPGDTIGRIPCVKYDLKENYPDIKVNILAYFSNPGKLHGTYSITRNGRHHSMFQMEILNFNFGANKPGAIKNPIGTWASGFTGKDLIKLATPTLMTTHVSHKVYRVVTVVNPPFVYRKPNCTAKGIQKKENNEYAHCFYGYSIDVMNGLARELNFNYTIFATKGYGYLHELPDKGWNGTIRVLLDGKADIALGALTHMPEREKVVDFTRKYHPMVGFTFVMQKPKVSNNLFKFMMVLERDVWWCILGAYLFTSLLLCIFDRFSPSSYQNNKEFYDNETDEPVRNFYLRECLWFCFTSMTPQGGGEAPKGLSGRLVASTWWLFSFIIIASYTANMAAFLTVSRLAKPILSFDDLITQHRVQYSAVIGSSAWAYFDRMANVEQIFYEYWRDLSLDDSLSDYNRSQLAVWTYPVSDKYTKLWQSMVTNRPPNSFQEGVERVLHVNKAHPNLVFAMIGEETDLKYLTMIHCNLHTVGEGFSKRAYAIAVTKGSPLKDQFNAVLDKMEKNRELEKIYDDWWRRNPFDKKCARGYRIEDGINFANLGGIWLIAAVGLACSVIAVFTEIIICALDKKIQTFKTKVNVYKDKASTTPGLSWMFLNRQKTDFETDFKTEYSNTDEMADPARNTSAVRDARLGLY